MLRFTTDKIFFLGSLFPKEATISLGEQKYNMIASMGALFSVVCKEIKNKSSGTEVILSFVNFYAVNETNIKVNITYSKENNSFEQNATQEEFLKKITDHEKFKKTKTETISNIASGTSGILRVYIPEYKPEELKFLSVSIDVGGMTYRK